MVKPTFVALVKPLLSYRLKLVPEKQQQSSTAATGGSIRPPSGSRLFTAVALAAGRTASKIVRSSSGDGDGSHDAIQRLAQHQQLLLHPDNGQQRSGGGPDPPALVRTDGLQQQVQRQSARQQPPPSPQQHQGRRHPGHADPVGDSDEADGSNPAELRGAGLVQRQKAVAD